MAEQYIPSASTAKGPEREKPSSLSKGSMNPNAPHSSSEDDEKKEKSFWAWLMMMLKKKDEPEPSQTSDDSKDHHHKKRRGMFERMRRGIKKRRVMVKRRAQLTQRAIRDGKPIPKAIKNPKPGTLLSGKPTLKGTIKQRLASELNVKGPLTRKAFLKGGAKAGLTAAATQAVGSGLIGAAEGMVLSAVVSKVLTGKEMTGSEIAMEGVKGFGAGALQGLKNMLPFQEAYAHFKAGNYKECLKSAAFDAGVTVLGTAAVVGLGLLIGPALAAVAVVGLPLAYAAYNSPILRMAATSEGRQQMRDLSRMVMNETQPGTSPQKQQHNVQNNLDRVKNALENSPETEPTQTAKLDTTASHKENTSSLETEAGQTDTDKGGGTKGKSRGGKKQLGQTVENSSTKAAKEEQENKTSMTMQASHGPSEETASTVSTKPETAAPKKETTFITAQQASARPEDAPQPRSSTQAVLDEGMRVNAGGMKPVANDMGGYQAHHFPNTRQLPMDGSDMTRKLDLVAKKREAEEMKQKSGKGLQAAMGFQPPTAPTALPMS